MGAIEAIGGDSFWLRLFNYAMLALSTVLLYELLKRHSSTIGAVVAVLLAAAYPVYFYTAGQILPLDCGICPVSRSDLLDRGTSWRTVSMALPSRRHSHGCPHSDGSRPFCLRSF